MPLPSINEVFVITLDNGVRVPVDPAAFEEILKADRRNMGELVAVSPFDYISTVHIVSAFKKIITEAPSPPPVPEEPAPTEPAPAPAEPTPAPDLSPEPSSSELSAPAPEAPVNN